MAAPRGGYSILVATLVAAVISSVNLSAQSDERAPDPPRPAAQPELRDPKVTIAWNRYYDYPEIEELVERLCRAYPDQTRLESLGRSVEGREMWLLTVSAPGDGSPDEKPAMWVDANVHGNEIQGSETCLYIAWYLLENYGRVPRITELLDRMSFYIFPMVNPDGRAWWFQHPNSPSASRSGKRPTDNDGDGLLDEDGSDDIDGDGEILQMRIRDPEGRWKTSAEDPRLMERVEPGERGEWTLIWSEGIDNDDDGRVNEDGPGGYDMNRNWPSHWMPGYVQYGAGEYPFSYPETRCVGEFLFAHPNVAAVQSFHNSGGMILRGPGVESFGSYPRSDTEVLDRIGREGEKMLPFYRYMILWKDLYSVYGGFATWTFEGLGIFSFTNEQWTSRRLYQRQDPSPTREERLEFDDLLRSGIDYVEWKPFTHPTLGEIELGGWRKVSGRVPPSFLIEEMLHRNALFTIYHGEQIPELTMDPVAVRPLGGGRSQIDVAIRNRRAIPTIAAHARARRIGLPDLLRFESDELKVVFAGEVTSRHPDRLTAIPERPGRILNWKGVGFRTPYLVRWIVEGTGTFEITYRSQKANSLKSQGEVR